MMLGRFIRENACGCKYQKRLKQTNEKKKTEGKKKVLGEEVSWERKVLG